MVGRDRESAARSVNFINLSRAFTPMMPDICLLDSSSPTGNPFLFGTASLAMSIRPIRNRAEHIQSATLDSYPLSTTIPSRRCSAGALRKGIVQRRFEAIASNSWTDEVSEM